MRYVHLAPLPVCAFVLLTGVACVWVGCRAPQAAGLPVYASHADRVDVMLATIVDGRHRCLDADANWATKPLAAHLDEYKAAWTAYRADEAGARPARFVDGKACSFRRATLDAHDGGASLGGAERSRICSVPGDAAVAIR